MLIWGAGSSVGFNAVQLAIASGYDVVAVASARSRDVLLELGATDVLDHRSPDVVDLARGVLRGRTLAGTLHANGEIEDTLAVVACSNGSRRVATTWFPPQRVPDGIEIGLIRGQSFKDDDLGEAIFANFLPLALEERRYRALPSPRVVGEGLAALQTALDAKREDASGAKIVVRLR